MIEIGNIYRLHAPWHKDHGQKALVAAKRLGVSEAYVGRTVYHISTGTFGGGIDLDEEFVEENFVEMVVDPEHLRKIIKIIKSGTTGISVDGMLSATDVTMFIRDGKLQTYYQFSPPGSMTSKQVANLLQYFNDDGNFIWTLE